MEKVENINKSREQILTDELIQNVVKIFSILSDQKITSIKEIVNSGPIAVKVSFGQA